MYKYMNKSGFNVIEQHLYEQYMLLVMRSILNLYYVTYPIIQYIF